MTVFYAVTKAGTEYNAVFYVRDSKMDLVLADAKKMIGMNVLLSGELQIDESEVASVAESDHPKARTIVAAVMQGKRTGILDVADLERRLKE